jgi:histidyl-tRNA synthetase
MVDITVAIDKLDKIGLDKVREELLEKELSADAILVIENYLNIQGSNEEKLNSIRTLFQHSRTGQEGITELEFVLDRINDSSIDTQAGRIQIDLTLARGLNYYTGLIFEAKGPSTVKMGSIGGGGRYDDLTGLFGVPNIPGVGISFGVDRIYDVLEELELFPATVARGTKVLFLNFGDEEARTIYKLVHESRQKGIAAELFPEPVKSDKQFRYAEKRNIPFVVLIGKRELETDQAILKNIVTGDQKTFPINQLLLELEKIAID